MPTIPVIAVTRPAPNPGAPPLVLGPSLGTSAATLWGPSWTALGRAFDVLAWDLPGHGRSRASTADFGVEQIAAGVLAALDPVLDERGEQARRFHYAGDSLGGAVGLQLLLDQPERVRAATLLCTGAKIGTADGWATRAATVEAEGTAAVVDGSRQRWFAPGFTDRDPATAEALLDALRAVHRTDYARACHALAGFDVRARLGEIGAPVLAVAGAADEPTPVASLREIAEQVGNGRLVVLDEVAHLAPAEAPARVTDLLIAQHGPT